MSDDLPVCEHCGDSPDMTVADRQLLEKFGAVSTTCPNCGERASFEAEGFPEDY